MEFHELYREEVKKTLLLEDEVVRLRALLVAMVNSLGGELVVDDSAFVEGTISFADDDGRLKITLEKNE